MEQAEKEDYENKISTAINKIDEAINELEDVKLSDTGDQDDLQDIIDALEDQKSYLEDIEVA